MIMLTHSSESILNPMRYTGTLKFNEEDISCITMMISQTQEMNTPEEKGTKHVTHTSITTTTKNEQKNITVSTQTNRNSTTR